MLSEIWQTTASLLSTRSAAMRIRLTTTRRPLRSSSEMRSATCRGWSATIGTSLECLVPRAPRTSSPLSGKMAASLASRTVCTMSTIAPTWTIAATTAPVRTTQPATASTPMCMVRPLLPRIALRRFHQLLVCSFRQTFRPMPWCMPSVKSALPLGLSSR